jgi:hypothetical protein
MPIPEIQAKLNSIEKCMNRSGLADDDDHDYAFEALGYIKELVDILKEVNKYLEEDTNANT